MPSALPAFDTQGGRVEVFDDGHCPETFRFESNGAGDAASGEGDAAPRIVRYDLGTSADVHVYDDVLDNHTARMLYKVTAPSGEVQEAADLHQTAGMPMKLEGESPWGTYVTIKEALEWIEWSKREGRQSERCNNEAFDEHLVAWKQRMLQFRQWQTHARQSSDEKKEEIQLSSDEDCNQRNLLDDVDYVRHALAVEVVATFFVKLVASEPGTAEVACASSDESSDSAQKLYEQAQFLEHAHGVAVWALSSDPGDSVQYHLDYAELVRYEYNVTVPPLFAGTIQCSALWNEQGASNDQVDRQSMRGGEFCVNLRGLDHYAEHGYKGNLSGEPMGGWRRPEGTEHTRGGVKINSNTQWVTIPYAFNRGIVHRGDLPHLSAPVESINGRGKCAFSSTSRVIVGFNVFGHDVGERVAKAPEHSKAFRRKVKLYRSAISASSAGNGMGNKGRGGMDISQIRKNKGLTKLLVLAKRERVKEELRRNQQQLSDRIWSKLLSNHRQGLPLLRVADLVEEFGSSNDVVDGAWPNSTDVHVHLNHMLRSTKDSDGGAVYCIQAMTAPGEALSGLIDLSMELDVEEC